MNKENGNSSMQRPNSATSSIFKNPILSTVVSFLCCFIVISCYHYNQYGLSTLRIIETIPAMIFTNTTSKEKNEKEEGLRMNQTRKKCDIFDGKWVYEEKGLPMYEPFECPFLSDQVSCRKNGRPDSGYEKWRWEAMDCEIPRFNGTNMLEKLRGKKVIIVGDSLNRNQWESLSCLLYSALPSKSAYVDASAGDYKIFGAKDYNCTVEFFWSSFLVELDQTLSKLLMLDTFPASAEKWQGADIMIFNTGHWWMHTGNWQAWDLMQYKGKAMNNLTAEHALVIGMETWGRWVDENVDSSKTIVFFRSVSPQHNGYRNMNLWCYNQTQPINDDESFVQSFPNSMVATIERRIRMMKTPVRYLNITKLSEYRRDAHPTVYTSKQGKLLTEEQRRQPEIFADCSHWCLPGVPDTWNQLLYTSIVLETLL